MSRKYTINEVFYSIQGEGIRSGTANVFVRFTGCNLQCRQEEGPKSPGGFDCDTEFTSGRPVTLDELNAWIEQELSTVPGAGLSRGTGGESWLILTGGEPALQVDLEFCQYFHDRGFKLAVETNGSIELPRSPGVDVRDDAARWDLVTRYPFDWITVSPKVAEHAIRQTIAHEVKYVRGYGQAIPRTSVRALHHVISPAFAGMEIDRRALAWCIDLVRGNPQWRLSCQSHKLAGVR